ncbi:MAG: alpha/beta hydrolase, partial [Prochlorotrichaceae cyanobacterium]
GIASIPRSLWLALRIGLVAYGTLFAYALLISDRQIYLPPERSLPVLSGGLTLETASGTAISALYWPAETDQAQTILYSHGNAEDLFALQNTLADFQDRGYGVLAYDYPGYGQSEGKPSERGVYEAIDAAYQYLTIVENIPTEQILVYGRSLGGGPSLDVVARKPVGGLILEATFVSIYRVVTRIPLLPIDKFRNLAKIPAVDVPLLIFHGTEDTIVPFWHGEALYEAATTSSKHLEVVEGAGHNDLKGMMGDRYWQVIEAFSQGIP